MEDIKNLIIEIKKQENTLRKITENKYNKQMPQKLHLAICACLDMLGDTMLAIENCFIFCSKNFESEFYIKLFGLALSMKIQEDIISKLFEYIDENFTFGENFSNSKIFSECIINIISNIDNKITIISRPTISTQSFEISSIVTKNNYNNNNETIEYKTITEKHLEELNKKLDIFISLYFIKEFN